MIEHTVVRVFNRNTPLTAVLNDPVLYPGLLYTIKRKYPYWRSCARCGCRRLDFRNTEEREVQPYPDDYYPADISPVDIHRAIIADDLQHTKKHTNALKAGLCHKIRWARAEPFLPTKCANFTPEANDGHV